MSRPEETAQGEWVERLRAGEPAAWDRLLDEHYRSTGRFLFQLVPEARVEDVEEILQDTFIAAIRGVKSFEGRSALRTWLWRIAANKARDFIDRSRSARRGGGLSPLPLETVRNRPGDGPSPDEQAASAEVFQELRAALDRLGDPCREILELRYFADADYAAIGASLQLHPKTVSSRLNRCLHRLGGMLHGARASNRQSRTAGAAS